MPPKSPRQNQLPFLPVACIAGINFQANLNILFSLLLLGTETNLNLNQSVFLRVDSSSDGWKLQWVYQTLRQSAVGTPISQLENKRW